MTRGLAAWLIMALFSPLLVQDARAEERESAEDVRRVCLVKVRQEMNRREVKSLDLKVQETVDRLCSLGQTERALSFAFPTPSPPPPASPGPDPNQDIEVTFRTEFEGGPDSGKISGHVKNNSSNTYGCVHLEFQMYTPSSGTRPEKGLRPLSTIGTEVRSVLPGSTVFFEHRLDCPVSLGLKTVSRCQNTLKAQNGSSASPQIVSFRIEPQVINRGEFVRLFWEIEGAEHVLLYDDFGVLDSMSESGWASSMTGYQQEQLNESTQFRLWAVGKTGCVSKSFEVTVRGKVID